MDLDWKFGACVDSDDGSMSRCRWKACKHRTRLSGNNQTDLPSWDETFKRGQGKSLAGLLLCLVGRAVLSVSWPGSGLVWLKFPTVAEACPERGHQEKTESGLISKNQKMYKNFYCNTQQKLPVGVCVFTLLLSTSACIFSLSLSLFFFVPVSLLLRSPQYLNTIHHSS